jgi:2-oxoisovalerate dehydrogenase E2 component (dihydrolipoyl transacylase)
MLPKLMLPKLLPRCGAMLRCRARGISGLTLPVLRVGAPSTALRQPLRQAARALASASAPSPGGSHPFLLADIGEGIAEVEVLQWFVGPGDTVEQFDRVCEVQSDKATVEISSPYVGRIESIAYAVGSIAKVGTPLLHIVLEGTATEPAAGSSAPAAGGALAAAAAAAAAPGLATAAGGRLPPGKALATPATRAMAKQHGIDLSTLVGTGREGRVTKEDVLAVLSGPAPASPPAVTAPSAVTAPPRTPAPATATTAPAPAAAMPAPPSPPRRNAATSDYEVAIKGIRKAMFAQMTAALAVPHFGYCDEVRMDELMAVRQQLKVAAAEAGLPKFTLMPLIVRATSLALAQHPELSASISAGAHSSALSTN